MCIALGLITRVAFEPVCSYNKCIESIWQLHIRQNKTFDDDHNEELRHASNRAHVLIFTVHGNMLLNLAAATAPEEEALLMEPISRRVSSSSNENIVASKRGVSRP